MKKVFMILLLVACLAPLMAWAQDAETPAAEDAAPAKMTLMSIIKTGGWAMWPLGACSIGVVTMCILNARFVSRKNLFPIDLMAQLEPPAQDMDVWKVYSIAKARPCLFTNGLLAGLRKLNPDDPAGSKGNMEGAIAETVGRDEAQVGFWINFLSLIAGISPMLGLLGTVSGMIGAFQKIGQGGMGKPELLAGNIGEALITTATGLTIAIPAVFAYFLFRNNLSRIIRDCEGAYSILLDALTGTGAMFHEDAAFESAPAGVAPDEE